MTWDKMLIWAIAATVIALSAIIYAVIVTVGGQFPAPRSPASSPAAGVILTCSHRDGIYTAGNGLGGNEIFVVPADPACRQ
jgi:hypothetical protein